MCTATRCVGFRHGWRGVLDGETVELTIGTTRGLIHRGGTILGTSRTNPFQSDDGVARALDTLARERIDALVAIGGEDTLGVAARLADEAGRRGGGRAQDDRQRPRRHRLHVRVPDRGADRHRRHRPAAHHRREPRPGDGGGGDGPPRGLDRHPLRDGGRRRRRAGARGAVRHRRGVRPHRAPSPPGRELLDRRRRRGRGAARGHPHPCRAARTTRSVTCASAASATSITEEIERRTGFETRVTILGHVLRGGTPTAYDRMLATRFGIAAIDAVHDGEFGTMVALQRRTHRAGADRRRGPRAQDRRPRAARRGRRVLRMTPLRSVAPRWSTALSVPASTISSAFSTSESLEVNLFRGVSLDRDRVRLYGGEVLAQALMAAGRTVDGERRVHSMHAYFLKLGDPKVPVVYEVDRIRDGRSFTTRRVVAIQHGTGDLQPGGVVPGRRAGARPPRRDARRARRPRRAVDLGAGRSGDDLEPIDRKGMHRTSWTRSTCVTSARRGRPPGEHRGDAGPRPRAGHVVPHPRSRCPTTHSCTRASSRTRPTSRCSAPPCCRTRWPRRHRVHGGEPRPRDVVPPAVPRRRVAAVPHAQPVGAARRAASPPARSSAPTARSR